MYMAIASINPGQWSLSTWDFCDFYSHFTNFITNIYKLVISTFWVQKIVFMSFMLNSHYSDLLQMVPTLSDVMAISYYIISKYPNIQWHLMY